MSALRKYQYQPSAEQQELFEPANYLRDYSGRAYCSLLVKTDAGGYSQRSFPVDSLHAVLSELTPEQRLQDVWISQAEFWTKRRLAIHVSRIFLCFVDLDTYSAGIQVGAEQQLAMLQAHCKNNGIPQPNLVVYSGRGLQAKWVLESGLPSQALPRWSAVQRELCKKLAPLGADARALDVSRVLRLTQTVNTKSGQTVRVLHHDQSNYDFEQLCGNVLPYTREQIREWREQAKERKEQRPAKADVFILRPGPGEKPVHRGNDTSGLVQFRGSQLAWDRLRDLRVLAKLRADSNGAVPDGQRDTFLFLSACFLVQINLVATKVENELDGLAREYAPHWKANQLKGCITSAMKRLKMMVKGEKVIFNGVAVDPRYRFRNETLISAKWLNVTEEEQKHLSTIISKEESKLRDAQRGARKRLEKGVQTLEQKKAATQDKRQKGLSMREQGATWKEVAEALGYSNGVTARIACTQAKKG